MPCVRIAFLARHRITGPLESSTAEKASWTASRCVVDWRKEHLERVTHTILKRHNAKIHSQTAIDAALGLRHTYRLSPADIDGIEVETFDVAHDVIGGGEDGDKTVVTTREEADHSLPYIVAVALIDGEVGPAQFTPGRISDDDVQPLLRRVSARINPDR